VRGAPDEDQGIVNLSLAPDPAQPGRMVVNRQGRSAETAFEVLRRWRGYTQLRLHPLTGRTHQLRVHMAAIRCPILADRLYAEGRSLYLSHIKPGYKFKRDRDERPLIRQLALHAERLRFRHPVSGMEVEILAPLPHDFLVGIKYLDRFAAGQGQGGDT
jgi:23S rRNA pseudouridine1911/1915/1917 synthase